MSIFSNLFGPAVPTLKPAEVQEKLKNGKRPFLLDVREKQELREGYISGAKSIPVGQLNRRMKGGMLAWNWSKLPVKKDK